MTFDSQKAGRDGAPKASDRAAIEPQRFEAIRDRAKAIINSGRKTNRPHPEEPGMRIVGWVVPDDTAGLSDVMFALGDIEMAAIAHFKSD